MREQTKNRLWWEQLQSKNKNNLRGYVQDRRGYDEVFYIGCFLLVYGIVGIIRHTSSSTSILSSISLSSLIGMFFFGVLVLICYYEMTAIPKNNPWHYIIRNRNSTKEKNNTKPLLVCLGDSLTQGALSANWTTQIVWKLKKGEERANDETKYPLDIVNAGQNSLLSHVVLKERIQPVLECQPDYVIVMIGSNDILAMYRPWLEQQFRRMWELQITEDISWESYQHNLQEILERILLLKKMDNDNEGNETVADSSSTTSTNRRVVQVAVCTLPLMGEDLLSESNRLVQKANSIIYEVVVQVQQKLHIDKNNIIDREGIQQEQTKEEVSTADPSSSPSSSCVVLPVFETMRDSLLQHNNNNFNNNGSTINSTKTMQNIQNKKKKTIPIEYFPFLAALMLPFRALLRLQWKTLSKFFWGHVLVSDSIHLNETGGEIITNLATKWLLMQEGIKSRSQIKQRQQIQKEKYI